jgi:hypothetical protein
MHWKESETLRTAIGMIGMDAEDTCEYPKYGIVRLEPVVIARVRRCRSRKTLGLPKGTFRDWLALAAAKEDFKISCETLLTSE